MARSTSAAREWEVEVAPAAVLSSQSATARVSSGFSGTARSAPLFLLVFEPSPAEMLLPSSRMAVAWALAVPDPALALVQLTQVSSGLTRSTSAVALLGGAGVTTVSFGVLWRVVGAFGAATPTGGWGRCRISAPTAAGACRSAGGAGSTGTATQADGAGCAWIGAPAGGAGTSPRPAARTIPPPRSSEAVAAATMPVRTRLLITIPFIPSCR